MFRRIHELEEEMECRRDEMVIALCALENLNDRLKRVERVFRSLETSAAKRERNSLKNRLLRLDERWLA